MKNDTQLKDLQDFKHLIVVQVNVPDEEAKLLVWPRHAVGPAFLLANYLTLALTHFRVLNRVRWDESELNIAAYYIHVDDLNAALRVVRERLDATKLLHCFAQVWWHDEAEDLWRQYPNTSKEPEMVDLNRIIENPQIMAMKASMKQMRHDRIRRLESGNDTGTNS